MTSTILKLEEVILMTGKQYIDILNDRKLTTYRQVLQPLLKNVPMERNGIYWNIFS